VQEIWQSNELRIRVARSRDTILGWTKSGAWRLLWSFNERRRVVGGATRGARSSGRGCEEARRPSDERRSRIGTRRISRNPSARQTAPPPRDERARTSKPHRAKTLSWRPHPLRRENAHPDQDPRSTLWTAHRQRIGGLWRRRQDGRRLDGIGWRDGEESPGLIELATAGRTPDPVVAHLHASTREYVLEEALEKRDAGERDPANVLGPIVPVAEGNLPVLDSFQTAVGDGDAEDVAAQVVEDLLAAPGVLAVDDPRLRPDIRGHLIE
jgi:hypothetical protein